MHAHDTNTRRQGKTVSHFGRVVLYTVIGFCFFGMSYLATLLFTHWDTVNSLIYESSLAKYEIMSGQRGPTTYLIFHSDFAALASMANEHEDILGVEQHEGSTVAKMAFRSAKSTLIDEVRALPAVSSMINRNVPMICH